MTIVEIRDVARQKMVPPDEGIMCWEGEGGGITDSDTEKEIPMTTAAQKFQLIDRTALKAKLDNKEQFHL